MRKLVGILFLLVAFSLGCASTRPVMNLNQPLCFINRGGDNTRYALLFGSRMWFRHFPNLPRPIYTQRFSDCRNPPIIVYERDMDYAHGVTKSYAWGYEVFLDRPSGARFLPAAHEIGHVLGVWYHIVDHDSIMTADAHSGEVTREDILLICKLHPEIQCDRVRW
jgi:hypothetical protein